MLLAGVHVAVVRRRPGRGPGERDLHDPDRRAAGRCATRLGVDPVEAGDDLARRGSGRRPRPGRRRRRAGRRRASARTARRSWSGRARRRRRWCGPVRPLIGPPPRSTTVRLQLGPATSTCDDVVEQELVQRAPLDLGRRGHEGEAGQVLHVRQRHVQQVGVGELHDPGGGRLVGGGDEQHGADLAGRRRVGVEVAEDGVPAVAAHLDRGSRRRRGRARPRPWRRRTSRSASAHTSISARISGSRMPARAMLW